MSDEILSKLSKLRIAVVGDVMLDEYLTGGVTRISPEAPVPVVRDLTARIVPGGAANVAANITALGATVQLVGVVGDDVGRTELISALTGMGVTHCDGLLSDASRVTIRKRRIIANHQHVVRLDYEDTRALAREVEDAVIAGALQALEQTSAVVLSDYGKGVLTQRVLDEILGAASAQNKIVVVDPKRSDLSAYRGATLMTPNKAELALATGMAVETDDQAEAAARKAQQAFGGDILLTRSEKGMSYYPLDGAPLHFPAVAREVFDVSGAGDTVVAVIAALLGAGVDIGAAIRIANQAAGIVVGKEGTAILTPEELAEAFDATSLREPEGRLVDREEASAIRRRWRRRGLTVGLANGCFDLLHPGHISLLRQAAANCDRLIVALNSDASVRRLKGPSRPRQSQAARAEVMGALKGVALVVLFDEDTPLEIIQRLEPEVLVKGEDYALEDVVGGDFVRANGGRVILAKLMDGHSTTRLLDERREAEAGNLLHSN
jgi:D-beta-D-heptose 7-phosphate kinase/D-beta-D-heptose 1-phosphate adenosyltransferase